MATKIIKLLAGIVLLAPVYALAQDLTLPAVGTWNGYNNHLVVVECNSINPTYERLRLVVRDNYGSAIAVQPFDLPAYGTMHIILNQYDIADAYGTYLVERVAGTENIPLFNCATVIYRESATGSPKVVDYAFTIPVFNGKHGSLAGIYNSMNASGSSVPVANWLNITNSSSSPFNADIRVYNQEGVLDVEKSFRVANLQPGERRDLALGHPYGQVVGMYQIAPDNQNQEYIAYVARYSQIDTDRYNYAFALLADEGRCEPEPITLSTMDPATNYAEIGNASAVPVYANVEIRDRNGALRFVDTIFIPPFSQRHIFVNQYLGARQVGSLRVRCVAQSSSEARLLVQSVFYGHRPEGGSGIEWAYSTQARGLTAVEGSRIAVSYNTYHGAANWLKGFDVAGRGLGLNIGYFDQVGTAKNHRSYGISALGSTDIGLHDATGGNAAGLAVASTSSQLGAFTAELLRVFPDSRGGIGYIMNVPVRIGSVNSRFDGQVRVASTGHWFEFRERPTVLVGDSVTQAWMELGNDFNVAAYLDALQVRGISAIMIWSFIGIDNQVADSRIGYNAPRRWPWRELSGNVIPPYNFQLVDAQGEALFNEDYFAALSTLVREANDRDILVLITVHDGWTKRRFTGHPLNIQNGGSLTAKEQYVELADYFTEMPTVFQPTWSREQKHQFYLERFCNRLIAATANYPNVMYEIFNEGEWYDQSRLRAFQVRFLDFFRKRTDLPLLVNDDHVGGDHFRADPHTTAISLHDPNWDQGSSADDSFGHYAERFFSLNPLAKPIIFSEPVPEYLGSIWEHDAVMRLLWGTLLGGGGFMLQDDSSWKIQSAAAVDPIFDYLGYAAQFFDQFGVQFWNMTPNSDLASSGIALSDSGREYLVYSQSGSSVTLDLSASSGNFVLRFLNPRTGTFPYASEIVAGGGASTVVTKPNSSDWVLWLVRE